MEKVESGLVHYAYFRPHQGLGGATPGDLLRPDAVAPFRDPASPRQARRRPDGFAVSHRVPRCRTLAASAVSKSSLKGGHEAQRRVLEWADLRAPSGRARANLWSPSARTSRNSHCTPTGFANRGHIGRQVVSTRTGISFLTGTVKSEGGGILKSESVAGIVPDIRV
jgi:hypothetical protein